MENALHTFCTHKLHESGYFLQRMKHFLPFAVTVCGGGLGQGSTVHPHLVQSRAGMPGLLTPVHTASPPHRPCASPWLSVREPLLQMTSRSRQLLPGPSSSLCWVKHQLPVTPQLEVTLGTEHSRLVGGVTPSVALGPPTRVVSWCPARASCTVPQLCSSWYRGLCIHRASGRGSCGGLGAATQQRPGGSGWGGAQGRNPWKRAAGTFPEWKVLECRASPVCRGPRAHLPHPWTPCSLL